MTAADPANRSGLIVAAPSSGSGKTILSLAIMRALCRAGESVQAFKCGPDYIDPQFHALACGRAALNLDPWAMNPPMLANVLRFASGNLIIVEGVMGVVDGAGICGQGSTADLASRTGLPIVMIISIANQSHSAVLPAAGFRSLRPELKLAGVILNRASSSRHAAMARRAFESIGIECLGVIPRTADLELPQRHLGLRPAAEHPRIEAFLEQAADILCDHVDLNALRDSAGELGMLPCSDTVPMLAPLGQRIAIASDIAFCFTYEHMLAGWRQAGAELRPFSPLADEAPDVQADAIFLPGGYPELHAGTLAAAARFRAAMHRAAQTGAVIYGECGGYMTLGHGLIDQDGNRHQMLGLLPVETSFATPKLHLGYRRLTSCHHDVLSGHYAGHEFHYAQEIGGDGAPLFDARESSGAELGPMGRRHGRICGSFAHVICRAAEQRASGHEDDLHHRAHCP